MNKHTATELAAELAAALDDPGRDVWPELATRAADHPAVQRAVIAIDAAKRAATLAVLRDLEGLVGAEVQRRHGPEVYVRALVAVLEMAAKHASEATPRFQPISTDDHFLGHSAPLATDVYAGADGNIALVWDGGSYRWTGSDMTVARYGHDRDWSKWLGWLDRYLESRR